MSLLPTKIPYELMLTRWSTLLNPLFKNKLIDGILISNISINNGVTVINHLLQRNQIGYVITDINGPATIYRSQSLNNLTLTLTSNATCIVSIWMF